MREKYIEERFPRWFAMSDSDPTLLVMSYCGGEDHVKMSHATAERLINARDAFVAEVVAALMDDEPAAEAVIGAAAQ